MTTDSKEYLDLLYEVQNENKPSLAVLLPGAERIYSIDLNARAIEAPEFLSVQSDHQSEVIYFRCPRYFDAIDLSKTVCVVQYINANKEGRIYAVPYYDVDTLSDTNEMLFPWVIEGEATKAAGDVMYSIRFFMMDTISTNKKFLYNLSTTAVTSKVLYGIDVKVEDWEDSSNQEYYVSYLEQILKVSKDIADKDVYWITL